MARRIARAGTVAVMARAWKAGESRRREFLADKAGTAAVIAAIMFPLVIGGLGLGAETGYWYLVQRELQHAADVSVHAAGIRKRAGDSDADIDRAALHVASRTGISASSSVLVNSPPASGPNAGDPDAIEVVISLSQPRLFSALFDDTPLMLSARAVARLGEASQACILALARTAPGAVTISGSTSVSLAGCDVASNSNAPDAFLMSGSGLLSTGCIFSVGGAVTTSSLSLTECDEVKEHASAVADPYRSVPEPVVQGTCQSKNVGNPNMPTTVTPFENHPSGVKAIRYCGGLSVKGKVTFEPGLYIIDGGEFSVSGGGAELVGSGVTFYLTNGASLKFNGNASMNLSAPASGPFSGILFFGGRDQTGVDHKLAGTADSVLQGAIYTPASQLDYAGNSAAADGCTQVVAYEVTFIGNSSLESSCEAAGTREIAANAAVNIVE